MAHTYILGQSGTGKGTLIKRHILDAIHNGHGVLYIDPHGTDTDELLEHIPPARRKDVYIFDPSWSDRSISYNPLSNITDEQVPYISAILRDAVKEGWGMGGVSTGIMDMFLLFSLSALIQAKETLLGLPYILTKPHYRNSVLSRVSDPIVKDFWEDFETYPPPEKRRTGKRKRGDGQ